MTSQLITEIKKINKRDIKKTSFGDYYISFRGNNNIIFKGIIHEKPEDLLGQEVVFYGDYKGLTDNQDQIFEFKLYELKDSVRYFYNKIIKIPKNALEDILKVMSVKKLDDILENDISLLTEYKGISKKTILKLQLNWDKFKNDKDLYSKFRALGFSNVLIKNIKEKFGSTDEVLKIFEKDPYKLVLVDGVSFKRIDQYVLMKSNIPLHSNDRLREGIKYSANEYMGSTGNTIINLNDLYNISKRNLNHTDGSTDNEEFRLCEMDFVSNIVNNNYFEKIENNLTLKSVYLKEKYIYDTINEKAKMFGMPLVEDIEEWIKDKEEFYSMKLSENQKNLIKLANKQPYIFSLSGYAGTGKTQVSKMVMNLYSENNKSIHCCALSGVAANRIKLVSGYESRTIHALLGFDGVNYSFNETNPLPYDLIIVDEAGMINADMFFYLLKAINFRRTKLFIIGDPAQLLPVGSGNVYNDLLLLNLLNNVTLTQVFRQKDGSIINIVAQDVRQFKFEEKYHNHNEYGFFTHFINSKSKSKEEDLINSFLKTLKNNKLKEYNETNLLDLQVITPAKITLMGTQRFNAIIQKELNKNETLLEVKEVEYKVNDKVIHLKNQKMDIYEEDMETIIKEDKIYNGQIGIIKHINKVDEEVFVYFPYEEQLVKYDIALLKKDYLGLAYALTAHKCQGNEFKDVIMIVSNEDSFMLNSNYLYSAMTRAKENLHIVGELEAILNGLKNKNVKNRQTILRLIGEKQK